MLSLGHPITNSATCIVLSSDYLYTISSCSSHTNSPSSQSYQPIHSDFVNHDHPNLSIRVL